MNSEFYEAREREQKRLPCHHDFESISHIKHLYHKCKKCSVEITSETHSWYIAGKIHGLEIANKKEVLSEMFKA